jgi:predicted phosphodiesterase
MKNLINWLHISDIHFNNQTEWSDTEPQEDLIRYLNTLFESGTPRPDLIFCTGDVAFGEMSKSPLSSQYVLAKGFFEKLLQICGFDGIPLAKDRLFIVPGNHDVNRRKIDPDAQTTLVEKARDSFSNIATINKRVEEKCVSFKRAMERLADFDDFIKEFLPLQFDHEGRTIFNRIVEVRGVKVGVAGFNSAWSCAGDEDDRNIWLAGAWQFGRARRALAGADVRFGLIHHPTDWLAQAERDLATIRIPQDFDFWLHGHSHNAWVVPTPSHVQIAAGAVSANTMEEFGFNISSIDESGGECGLHHYRHGWVMQTVAQHAQNGIWKFPLPERMSKAIKLAIHKNNKSKYDQVDVAIEKSIQEKPLFFESKILHNPTRVTLREGRGHIHVRKIEQEIVSAALKSSNEVWIVDDWGYGTEEFISTIEKEKCEVYRISLAEYEGRSIFLEQVQKQLGCSLQQFCRNLAGKEPALVIFDDVPVTRTLVELSSKWEVEIIDIVAAIREFAPNISVILISRQQPSQTKVVCVKLSPFDELDLKTYITEHPNGGDQFSDEITVNKIHRLTGGLPYEVDSTLKKLRLVSLSDLIEEDMAVVASCGSIGADSVMEIVKQLSFAIDAHTQRAFGLLKALICFPYGETLQRIKWFNSNSPFQSGHITLLAELGLIEATVVARPIGLVIPTGEQSWKYAIKRPVRDCLKIIIDEKEHYQILSNAARLYFGDNWTEGRPQNVKAKDLVIAAGGEVGLSNPLHVIRSILSHSHTKDDPKRFSNAVHLARSFVANLESSGYFRSCVTASRDFLFAIPDSDRQWDSARDFLNFALGKSLRMAGERELAIELLEPLATKKFEKQIRQRILLNLALAEKKNKSRAEKFAREVVEIGQGTFSGLQAKALLLELGEDNLDRIPKLWQVEKLARSKKAITVANNISFYCITNGKISLLERRKRVGEIIVSAVKNNDNYGVAKYSVYLAQLAKTLNSVLSDMELRCLIKGYHYMYDERIGGLFGRCHAELWRHFEDIGDVKNLLRLFRESSFIWRLRSEEEKENIYIEKLLTMPAEIKAQGLHPANTDAAYFVIRSRKLGK